MVEFRGDAISGRRDSLTGSQLFNIQPAPFNLLAVEITFDKSNRTI